MKHQTTFRIVNPEDDNFSVNAGVLQSIVAALQCPLWVVADFDTWEPLRGNTHSGAFELLKDEWHVISRNQLLSALEEVSISTASSRRG